MINNLCMRLELSPWWVPSNHKFLNYTFFFNFSPLFNHPSIVTRSQGYYQDQFLMFAVLERAQSRQVANGSTVVYWKCDNATRESGITSVQLYYTTYLYVFRLESCKNEGFLYGYLNHVFLSFIRYVRKFNAKKIKESGVLFKENSVGFLPYFNTNRLPIHSEYKLYLER